MSAIKKKKAVVRKTYPTSLALEHELWQAASERARQNRQSLSGYIKSLIDHDFEVNPPPPNGNGAAKAAEATADINAGLVFKLPGRDTEYTMTRGPHPKDFPEGADRNKIMEACQLWEAWRMDIEMSRAGDEVEEE